MPRASQRQPGLAFSSDAERDSEVVSLTFPQIRRY